MVKTAHETAQIAIDPVIFTINEDKLKILLHVREKEPFKDMLELPGTLLLAHETAEASLKRKLKELFGHEQLYLKQFYTFTEPKRDPRGRTISIGFVALIHEEKIKEFVKFYEYDSIVNLAFDHKKILEAARMYLKEHVDPSLVVQFMPKVFPLNRLQEIYEIIEDKKYDNRNFRKKMISSGIVEETKQREKNVSHRPAKLFKFS